MAVHTQERRVDSFEAEVVSALGIAGTRAVQLGHGEHRVLPPDELYPLGATASVGHSVRQRLSAIVRPPEGGLLGIVCAEVRDAVARERHAGVFVSHLALKGEPQASLVSVLAPGRMLAIRPEIAKGGHDWATAITVDPTTRNAAVLHRGNQATDVYAAPTTDRMPLLLPDASLWAPGAEDIFNAMRRTVQ